jgi:hypothetical protein
VIIGLLMPRFRDHVAPGSDATDILDGTDEIDGAAV